MKQASGFECLVFDPFSFQQDGLAAPKVNISRCQVGYALVVSKMVVVADEVSDLQFEIAGQIVVLKQDAVFECLMPSLDLALCLRMHGSTTDVVHAFVAQPCGQFARDVAGAIVAEQAWLVNDIGAVTA